MTQNSYSRNDWLNLHNRAAIDYINSEWSRENLFGVRKQRKKLFAQATGDVLDVGCGYGINFAYLINAKNITGVDFSPVMLNKARELTKKLGIQTDLREADAEHLEFADNTFDSIISTLATCSFFNTPAALTEMRRVCKPNGKMLFIEHGRSTWGFAARYQDSHAHYVLEDGGCRWNQEPQELIKEAGIKIVHAERTIFGVFHTISAEPNKS